MKALHFLELSEIHKDFKERKYSLCKEKLEQDEGSLKMVIGEFSFYFILFFHWRILGGH